MNFLIHKKLAIRRIHHTLVLYNMSGQALTRVKSYFQIIFSYSACFYPKYKNTKLDNSTVTIIVIKPSITPYFPCKFPCFLGLFPRIIAIIPNGIEASRPKIKIEKNPIMPNSIEIIPSSLISIYFTLSLLAI